MLCSSMPTMREYQEIIYHNNNANDSLQLNCSHRKRASRAHRMHNPSNTHHFRIVFHNVVTNVANEFICLFFFSFALFFPLSRSLIFCKSIYALSCSFCFICASARTFTCSKVKEREMLC